MYKTKLVHCCDVVPNLVVDIEIFNFCLFIYLSVCSSQFANLHKENGPIMIPKTVLKSGL